jgi:hypothetical protein
METHSSTQPLLRSLAISLVLFPSALLLVFLLHLRSLAAFLNLRMRYIPAAPDHMVTRLIANHNRMPLLHDPHMIAYLALPLIPLCAFSLFLLGRRVRPVASAIAAVTTVSGAIFMGGLFAMWIAFYRGLGQVDPQYTAGAIATFAAMTSPHGAFLVITSLAKLTMVGMAAQALVLLGTRIVPKWSIGCVTLGCTLFLMFWDLDNWMLIGSALLFAGWLPMSRAVQRVRFDPLLGA